MHEITCNHCGEKVSGPDKDSVTATMERHRKKRAHPAAVVAAPAPATGPETKSRWPHR